MNVNSFNIEFCPIIIEIPQRKKVYEIHQLIHGIRKTRPTTSRNSVSSTTEWLQKNQIEEVVEADVDIEGGIFSTESKIGQTLLANADELKVGKRIEYVTDSGRRIDIIVRRVKH